MQHGITSSEFYSRLLAVANQVFGFLLQPDQLSVEMREKTFQTQPLFVV